MTGIDAVYLGVETGNGGVCLLVGAVETGIDDVDTGTDAAYLGTSVFLSHAGAYNN